MDGDSAIQKIAGAEAAVVRLPLWREVNPVWRLAVRSCPGHEGAAVEALAALTALGVEQVDDRSPDLDLVLVVGCSDWACREIRDYRAAGWHLPVLAVSNQGSSNAVELLEAGADNHVEMPFDAPDLRARALALLRRAHSTSGFRSPIAIDPQTQRVCVREVVARLPQQSFRIFVYLAERQDRWVSPAEIIAQVCKTHHRDTSLVRVHIHAIRRALGQMRSCIRSDGRRRGYMFTLPSDDTVTGEPATARD